MHFLSSGLSAEDIGKWIKLVRGISLPITPDLQRIREYSAGLPFILEDWIRTSENLNDPEEIMHDDLCGKIIRLEEGLDELDQVRLYRTSILLQPLKHKTLARYLEMDDNIDLVRPFIKRLIQHRIFDEHLKWFRHELVQRCFKDDLDDEERTTYHDRAAEIFESLMEEIKKLRIKENLNEQNIDKTSMEVEESENYAIAKSCAYHMYKAGGKYREKSFVCNKEVAEYAIKRGDLATAERCYKRNISGTKNLARIRDEMDYLFDITSKVYVPWGRYEEALHNYQSLLEYYDRVNDSEMLSRVLNSMATIHSNNGEYDQAMQLCNQSLEISKQREDQYMIGRTLNDIANIHDDKGEYDKALELYNQSLEISKQREDQYMIASILNNIGLIHDRKGEYDKALEIYNQSMGIAKQIVDQQGMAYTLNNIGLAHSSKREYDKAMEMYSESLEISKQIGEQQMIGGTLNNIAQMHSDKGEYEQAFSRVLQAYEILERLQTAELQTSRDILRNIKDKLGSEAYERLVKKVRNEHLN